MSCAKIDSSLVARVRLIAGFDVRRRDPEDSDAAFSRMISLWSHPPSRMWRFRKWRRRGQTHEFLSFLRIQISSGMGPRNESAPLPRTAIDSLIVRKRPEAKAAGMLCSNNFQGPAREDQHDETSQSSLCVQRTLPLFFRNIFWLLLLVNCSMDRTPIKKGRDSKDCYDCYAWPRTPPPDPDPPLVVRKVFAGSDTYEQQFNRWSN